MNFTLEKPIVSFDIESTGTDVVQDRIIQFAAIRIDPPDLFDANGKETAKTWLINPGCSIPPASTRIHHITDAMVAQCPPFRTVAAEIHAFIGSADLIGYNLLRMDVPMLWEEFNRCGIDWVVAGRRIIDPSVIFTKKEPRTLAGAVQKYCGHEHTDAHEALADARANLDVLTGQCKTYADIGRMGLSELSEYCAAVEYEGEPARRLDLSGYIIEDKNGVARYTLKKVQGVAVEDDPGFGQWMCRNSFPEQTKRVLRDLIAKL